MFHSLFIYQNIIQFAYLFIKILFNLPQVSCRSVGSVVGSVVVHVLPNTDDRNVLVILTEPAMLSVFGL